MPQVKIFWDPSGFQLDSLGTNEYLRAPDGDTAYISMSIRMLSIDTPEIHYPGNQSPSKYDERLAQLAEWIQAGKAPINNGLAAYLCPKLATGTAGTLQEKLGNLASNKFKELLEIKLVRPNNSRRRVFLYTSNEPFDQYGRLLAYMAPRYSREELINIPRQERPTLNLLMVKSGWAATFPIYPSLPRYSDLTLLKNVAQEAYNQKKGAWADTMLLTGYEFRMAVKLYAVTKKLIEGQNLTERERNAWITRYCIDMTTQEIFYPEDYYLVKPYNRIFVWPKDVNEVVGKMNLIPGDRR